VKQTVREYLAQTGATLRSLAYAYSGKCWESWRAKKQQDLENPNNPFLGGPSLLLAQGITEIEGADGKMIQVGPLTRIRFRQLSDASLELLGILSLKGVADGGNDVIHQEYVGTFAENVANDPKHLMNNFLAAAAIIDGIVSYALPVDATVDDVVAHIEAILAGDKEVCVPIALMSRSSWVGRACMDGSWKVSSDFEFAYTLSDNTFAIDPYVAVPVLNLFLADLRSHQANS
jgi:hypothetical protein